MTTPRPWTVENGTGFTLVLRHGNEIARCMKYGVGTMPKGETCPWHSADANAALIVRAVNSYDAMKAALVDELAALRVWKSGVAAILNDPKEDYKTASEISGDILDGIEISEDKLQAALTLAEGKE